MYLKFQEIFVVEKKVLEELKYLLRLMELYHDLLLKLNMIKVFGKQKKYLLYLLMFNLRSKKLKTIYKSFYKFYYIKCIFFIDFFLRLNREEIFYLKIDSRIKFYTYEGTCI